MTFKTYLKQFNGYNGDAKRKKQSIFEIGSGNSCGKSGGATEETLRENIRAVVSHNFFDWNFYYNDANEDQQKDFLNQIDAFVVRLENDDKLFNSFWSKLIPSGRYDCLYNLETDLNFVNSSI